MRKEVLIWVSFILLVGCAKKKAGLPINEDTLVAILADVHLAEAAVQHLSGEIKDSTAELYYGQIFAIYGVSEADFDTSIVRLREDPDRLSKIYTEVLNRLDTTRVSDR